LSEEGAEVMYHDPHVPMFKGLRNFPDMAMKSVALTEEVLAGVDLAVLVTDHSAYDYSFIERHAKYIVDTRNAFGRKGIKSRKIFKA
jgi:UDP-N-acetyl-D-glucosamine dehydrogenase